MGNPDFDKRYPAMFQQGGEADLDAGRVSEPEQDEATESAVPLQSPAPKAVSTRLAQPNAERTPEPFPGTASEEDLRGAQAVPAPVPESAKPGHGCRGLAYPCWSWQLACFVGRRSSCCPRQGRLLRMISMD